MNHLSDRRQSPEQVMCGGSKDTNKYTRYIYEMLNFQPIHFVPTQRQAQILASLVTCIEAVPFRKWEA